MVELPKVSIITPSYNQAKFLEDAILSVLNQDYPNIEYIIIDGRSTDGSVEIIRKYEHRLAYWVSEQDKGQSDAINKGLRKATGQIWAWMNSDDLYLPGAVHTAVEWLDEHLDVGIVYGDCIWINKEGQEIDYQMVPPEFDYLNFLIGCNNYIPSGSTFIRRSVSEIIGGLDISMNMVMDMDYWVRAGLVCKMSHIPHTFSLYRIYDEAKTWALETTKGPEVIRIYEKLYNRHDLPLAVQATRRKAFGKAYLHAAHYAWKSKDRRAFWKYLCKSLGCGPRTWQLKHLRMVLDGIVGTRAVGVLQSGWQIYRHKLYQIR